VLDFGYMQMMRRVANEIKPDFWLMGEVIHGDYVRWVNSDTLHSVTNYHLHKALYSGHNDHNYFEIAHTVKRLYEMGGNKPDGLKLYNFADNHDVERIYTKLRTKSHFMPVHILLYTLPGIPSVYYGSEFGIEGRKEHGSDDSLRPEISYDQYIKATEENHLTDLIERLGKIRQQTKILSYGDYKELFLTNCQYAFSRSYNGKSVIVCVNNSESDFEMTLPALGSDEYVGGISGENVCAANGQITVKIKENSGEIWIPSDLSDSEFTCLTTDSIAEPPLEIEHTEPVINQEEITELAELEEIIEVQPEQKEKPEKSFEEMTVEELQEAILERMRRNGPVTEQMHRDVMENVYHNSLVTWVKSFC
ncbi:MAG: alpha-amylase, partial [Clostridia bacterium]|nr:alpha-amylase [Clostridia bacterium]